MKTVFLSWQSDIKPARNKIKAGLEMAVKQLGDELTEAERPEIDSDTKGTYGSEDIISTIFSKIDTATIFVADVTPIAETDRKMIPNPNVMTELGYAIKAKGPNTRLFIYCTDADIDIKKMPFDIRGKSLMGFKSSDTPSEIAKTLKPILLGMLTNAADKEPGLEHPYVYVSGGSHNNQYMSLSIKSDEADEYFLESIEIEGCSAQPNKSLAPKALTRNVILYGQIEPFSIPNPKVKMTISRGGRTYYVQQDIKTTGRVDGKYNLAQWIERPNIVSSFDE